MTDTIIVGSRAPITFTFTAPVEPGVVASAIVINGSNHPDAESGVGITRDVDAVLFHKWLDGEKANDTPLASLVYEMDMEAPREPDSTAPLVTVPEATKDEVYVPTDPTPAA